MTELMESPAENPTQQAPEKVYDVETYSISEDGHYVGQDGFVVPKDFPEFFARFPNQVRIFVRSRNWYKLDQGDMASDVEQALLLHLMTLPAKSKFREMGMTDRIQTFNPADSHNGASKGRFLSYIHRILLGCFVDIIRSAKNDPIDDSFTIDMEPTSDNSNHMEYNYSDIQKALSSTESENFADHADTANFHDMVRENNPELLPFLDYIIEHPNAMEARADLGMSRQLFNRAKTRLRLLFEHFKLGDTIIPTQRKVYEKRDVQNDANYEVSHMPITLDASDLAAIEDDGEYMLTTRRGR